MRQLEQMLEKHEVEEIEALGLKLDPNLHQAMVQIEDGEAEPGTIIQVMAAGYTIHGRLLRPPWSPSPRRRRRRIRGRT